jgi:hypothetical protein
MEWPRGGENRSEGMYGGGWRPGAANGRKKMMELVKKSGKSLRNN